MNQRILVTGGSGFVGKALIEEVLQRGMKVNVSSRQNITPNHPNKKIFLLDNLGSMRDWKDQLKGVQCVVHCAGRAHVMNDIESNPLAEFRKINVDETLNLARQAAALGTKRFVFISTAGVNGAQTMAGVAFREKDEPQPDNAYAISKWEAEKGLFNIAKSTGMDVVVIRPPLVYGYKAPGNFGMLMRVLLSGWPLPFGRIKNLRSFVALDVLIDFIVTCIVHPNASNQIFLVSDDHDISTSDFLINIARELKIPCRLFYIPLKVLALGAVLVGKSNLMLSLTRNFQVDISKARNTLNWKPPISFNEGLRRTANKVDLNFKKVN